MLLVMRPHPENFYGLLRDVNLINEPVLNIDTARIGSLQITDQLFVWRWILKWIFGNDFQ
jgi:hypothetical protein